MGGTRMNDEKEGKLARVLKIKGETI